ncbi:TPM domain-containing protein [Paracoccus sulfuroxidans]|uniref:TPM domain-containing protein n=1 Tax=Paracoccus sulfuroxidans TaxID=384678 RepID=A0A562NXU4_9RHOB|nr:TPM domain-containing protein [Paracoccus sulfuroxidans]TWI37014.1 uncharacterized protein IQ24_00804 [Paracoccus sulfuroxidans]
MQLPRRIRLLPVLALLALLLPASMAIAQNAAPAPQAEAQGLPQWQHTSVNDFARVLTPEDTRAIDEALIRLHDETGVEGTVVTLRDRRQFGGTDGLEPFATRLFNTWGVGDAQTNLGFMLLVLTDNHEARIELGKGFSTEADILAQDIMRNTVLPAFREDRMSQGIRDGTMAAIDLIARPVAAGQPLASRASGGNALLDNAVPVVTFGFIGFVIFMIIRRALGRNRCPKCGHRGLVTSSAPVETPLPDGGHLVSQTHQTRRCPACGWQDERQIPSPQIMYYGPTGAYLRSERNGAARAGLRGGSSSGFGGGSSSGGGASGRW